jgi:hypothetical protein
VLLGSLRVAFLVAPPPLLPPLYFKFVSDWLPHCMCCASTLSTLAWALARLVLLALLPLSLVMLKREQSFEKENKTLEKRKVKSINNHERSRLTINTTDIQIQEHLPLVSKGAAYDLYACDVDGWRCMVKELVCSPKMSSSLDCGSFCSV